MAINVFLSVGRTHNPAQEAFVQGVEKYLEAQGLRPQTVGRSAFDNKQPLRSVDKLMGQSAGALVLALERLSISTGAENGGPPQGSSISNQSLPTPWNQIEAALAYARRLPLLVIKQDTVRAEGLLEARYDWYVLATGLDLGFLQTAAFKGTFESWRRDVRNRAGWFGARG